MRARLISIESIAGVTALVILRLRGEPSEKKEFKKYSSFLVMGGLWFIVGMIFGPLYRGDGVFDSPLLMLGLVSLLAGGLAWSLNTSDARHHLSSRDSHGRAGSAAI